MAVPLVLIFHRPAAADDPPLVRLLGELRLIVADRQRALFERAGGQVEIVQGWPPGLAFGQVLAQLAPASGGVVVVGSGAVPLLNARDVVTLLATATAPDRQALTNNRYSSDVCALGQAASLRRLPAMEGDNALPRWLAEEAGYEVTELPARQRLALDIDTPLDAALVALNPAAPPELRRAVRLHNLELPRHAELRALTHDRRGELLVFGRSSSANLRWLERNVECRVRFLAEERGLRAGAAYPSPGACRRPPRATLGRLLERDGAAALAAIVAELADGAVIDSRVLLADRLGADEDAWPVPADRFASDLLRPDDVADGWLRALTASAAGSAVPITLGGHSLVGPGLPLLLRRGRARGS